MRTPDYGSFKPEIIVLYENYSSLLRFRAGKEDCFLVVNSEMV